ADVRARPQDARGRGVGALRGDPAPEARRRHVPRSDRRPEPAPLDVLPRGQRAGARGAGARSAADAHEDRVVGPDRRNLAHGAHGDQARARVQPAGRPARSAGGGVLSNRSDAEVLERHRGDRHDRRLPAARPPDRAQALCRRPREPDMNSPLVARMYWACAESLCLASELPSARALPPPAGLQRRLAGLLEDMTRRCRESGIPDEDINEARYAIVAFADEQIFRSAWPGRAQWMRQPLQLSYFNENTAGEGFFRHMAGLQNQPHRVHTLQISTSACASAFKVNTPSTGRRGWRRSSSSSRAWSAPPPAAERWSALTGCRPSA